MEQLMIVIIVWLAATFDLPEVHDLPEIRYLAPNQIAAAHYGRDGVGVGDVVSVYDDRTATIILNPEWSSRNVADTSVLVHELVHHLQNKTRLTFACPQEREALAYMAQQHWLQLFGSDLESAFGIDALSLKLKTNCLPW
jgi:hypothetical protein